MNASGNNKRVAIITGTSTGIGFDAARYLIERGWMIFGSVRNHDDAADVRRRLGERFHPLLFDVTDLPAIKRAAAGVQEQLAGSRLNGLINNAGIAVHGPLELLPFDEIRRQFEVNVLGVIAVIQAFIPLLLEPGGRIINVSSVSGQIAYPFFGPYAGSKFALEAISDSLRRELMVRGVDVIVIEPGSVQTPIWEKAENDKVSDRFSESIYGSSLHKLEETIRKTADRGMPVELVSRTIFKALTTRAPRPRYALPNSWFLRWFAPRYLPSRLVDHVIGYRLGLHRKDQIE